jgi:hypothetical protein
MDPLTTAHWVYLLGVVIILVTMLARKNIIVPAVLFTLLTGVTFTQSLTGGLAAVFNASLVAAQELFSIFLIIALVTGMLGALQALGADTKMVMPFRPVMRNGHLAFWTLAAVTYMISLFFWPTPAVPLIGAVLIPVAIRAGLRPMAVAFTIAVAGQGMALSSDFVIRVAPGLSATAANANAEVVANRAMVMSLIVGVTALVIGYVPRPSPPHWSRTLRRSAMALRCVAQRRQGRSVARRGQPAQPSRRRPRSVGPAEPQLRRWSSPTALALPIRVSTVTGRSDPLRDRPRFPAGCPRRSRWRCHWRTWH